MAATPSTASTPLHAANTLRLEYSCVLCKTRKVRCDRGNPCSACAKVGADCVPGTRAPYKRRRRAQPEPQANVEQSRHRDVVRPVSRRRPAQTPESTTDVPAFGQNLWVGLNDEFQDPQTATTPRDEDTSGLPRESPFPDPTTLIFSGSPRDVDLRGYYPSPMNAFTLWEAYLQNVNPLTKLIYAPHVQTQVLEVSRDYGSASRQSIALLFAIYAAAVASMSDEECQRSLGEPKKILHVRYVYACQQALSAAAFLKSQNLVLLQAFIIFLLSARQVYDAQTFWLLSGLAIRMGQRLKLNTLGNPAQQTFFEIQMRRRIWWQVLLIDGRSHQLSGIKPVFVQEYNSPLPENLNDADISPDMTEAPLVHKGPTEMVFCIVRYEIGKFLNTNYTSIFRPGVDVDERDKYLDELETYIEGNFLKYCDPAIPLHVLTMTAARCAICKMRLMAHHPSRYPNQEKSMPKAERDMLFSLAIRLIESAVIGQSTTSLDKFSWHMDVYFQIDAFVFLLIESRSQPPTGQVIDKAWHLICEMYRIRPALIDDRDNELYVAVCELTLRAWEAREAEITRQGLESLSTPEVIIKLKARKPQSLPSTAKPSAPAQSYHSDLLHALPGPQLDQGTETDRPDLDWPQVSTPDQRDTGMLFGGIFSTMDGEPELSSWSEVNWQYWDDLITRNMMQ